MKISCTNKASYLWLALFLFVGNAQAKTSAKSTKILVFGDFGTGDEHQKAVALDMKNFCDNHGCDFAVTVGDNIYPRGVESLNDGVVDYDNGSPNYKIITDVFVSMYQQLQIPLYISFGNHDVGNEGVLSIFKDLLKNGEDINKRTLGLMNNQLSFTNTTLNPIVKGTNGQPSRLWLFPAAYYHIPEKNDVHLFAIDTNTYPHAALTNDGELDIKNHKNERQSLWLEKELATIQDGWKIVFGHMPLYSHGNHGWKDAGAIKTFRKSIIDLLCKYNVDFYLAGHDHHLEVDKHECANGHVITAILTGAAAKTDRIYTRSFPILSKETNLLWGNGKEYKGDSWIYKSEDYVNGFTHIDIQENGNDALVTMKLTKGASADRKDACFMVTTKQDKNNEIKKVDCAL